MFSRGYRRYALILLTAVYMLNLVDRSLVMLLLQPIKEDLQLSDTQLGFVTGIAFGLFYATLGVPIARWADRGNRVSIASWAIGLWGLTVMACLFVTNYAQLLFARIAAAVGESGCKPPTYSLVGDYYPEPAKLTRAMAVYWLGSPIAALCSFVAGGWLNELYGWRMTFFLMGIPGLILAVLVKLTVREPRIHRLQTRSPAEAPSSMGAVLSILWQQRSCRHLSISLILVFMMSSGLGPWYAAFMVRSHGMGTQELGIWLGVIFGAGGILGTLGGGYVASRWFAQNERSQMRLSALALALLVPCFVAFLALPNRYAALAALMPFMALLTAFVAPTYALMQRLVPEQMRATTLAVVMLLANLIGMGLGPQVVGILSDFLAPMFGRESLRYAMWMMSSVALVASYHFWRVAQSIDADLAAARRNAASSDPRSTARTPKLQESRL